MADVIASFQQMLNSKSNKVIAIIGLSKNAGKTSVLNWILHNNPDWSYGVMSTGRDGEEIDTVYATPKPAVHLPANCIFCTDTNSINAHGASIVILQKLPWQAGKRQLWLAKSNTPIDTEIFGPVSVQAQTECLQLMQKQGSQKLVIDGSIDRKSIVLSTLIDSVILVAGASYGSITKIKTELHRLAMLCKIPLSAQAPSPAMRARDSILFWEGTRWKDSGFKSLIGHETQILQLIRSGTSHVYLPGAFTETSFSKMIKTLEASETQLIIRHPYVLQLSIASLERFLQCLKLKTAIPFKINAIAVNPAAVGAEHLDADCLRQEIKEEFGDFVVLDIMEAYDR